MLPAERNRRVSARGLLPHPHEGKPVAWGGENARDHRTRFQSFCLSLLGVSLGGWFRLPGNETIGASSASFFVCVAACSVAGCFRRSSAFAIREGIQLPYLAYESDRWASRFFLGIPRAACRQWLDSKSFLALEPWAATSGLPFRRSHASCRNTRFPTQKR